MQFNLNKIKIDHIFFLLLLISTFFLVFFTWEHYFFSDDFYYIIGPKLYTLITGQSLKIKDLLLNLGPQDHYAPLYYYYLQFMPSDAKLFHFVTIIFHSISALLVFFISVELIKNKKIALLAAMLYFYNMSMHSWPIVWNAFNAHIVNATTGFFALYLSLRFLRSEKNEIFFLLLISFFSGITIFIYESGFFYILLICFFQFFSTHNIKKRIKVLVSIFAPVIIYFSFTIHLSGVLHPISKRAEDSSTKFFYTSSNTDPSSIYARRSNYAQRNFINYVIRSYDNLINTFNIGTIEQLTREKITKYNQKKELKILLKNNILILILITLIINAIFFYLLIKIFINNLRDKTFLKLFSLYLLMLTITSIIFFRKDLSMALAFSGSLLISYLLFSIEKKRKLIKNIFITSYFLISFFYIIGGMQFVHVDYQKSVIKKNHNDLIKSINNFEPPADDSEVKFYYFYKNFKSYEKELKDFTKKNSHDFHSFAKNFVKFKDY